MNEVNTVPGSLARYLWVDPVVPFIDLLDGLIGEALDRPLAGATPRPVRTARCCAAPAGIARELA